MGPEYRNPSECTRNLRYSRRRRCTSMPKDLPDYAADPLRRFMDYARESERLLHISMRGLSMVQRAPQLLQALAKVEPILDHDVPADKQAAKALETQRSLELAKTDAEFADIEEKSGFPLLHAHTLVGLWGALEAAIEDMMVGILLNEPQLLQSDAVGKVKIPIAEFETLEKEERMRLLITEVERNCGYSKKFGVDCFDALLETIGVAGAVDPEVKKTCREMHSLRNVIVHRNSIVDRRLVSACPWLGLRIGDKVTVTHDDLGRYYRALIQYGLAITYRLGERYDVDIDAKIRHNLETEAKVGKDPGEVSQSAVHT